MAKSTVITATGNVHSDNQGGKLIHVHLAAGSDAATAKVYDDSSGTSNQLASLKANANLSDDFSPRESIDYGTNIRVAVTGTSPEVTVVYD